MNKTLTLFFCALFLISSIALADCGYVDHFHFNGNTAVVIQGLIGTNNLHAIKTSASTFDLTTPIGKTPDGQKTCVVNSDTATVQFGIDNLNYCSLRLRDGPFMTDPLAEDLSCVGNIHFAGITYDGIWTYTYTVHVF